MEKTNKMNELSQRYSYCDEAVQILDVMHKLDKLALKKVRRIYPRGFEDEGLIDPLTAIIYDIDSMKSELEELAMEIAEEIKALKEEKKNGKA